MKVLGVVLQNKKGENVLVATSSRLRNQQCLLFAQLIFKQMNDAYKRKLIPERTVTLQDNLICVLNVSRDFILYVFVDHNELGLAFDVTRKVTDFLGSNQKIFGGGVTLLAKLETIPKKLAEFTSAFEELLYSREINLKEYLSFLPQPVSKKKGVKAEILNRFQHITTETDKNVILNAHALNSDVEARKAIKMTNDIVAVQSCTFRSAYTLTPNDKSRHISQLASAALCGQKKALQICLASKGTNSSENFAVSQPPIIDQNQSMLDQFELTADLSMLRITKEQIDGESKSQNTMEPNNDKVAFFSRERLKLKLVEKLQLHLHNGKIKDVFQFGQLVLEGSQQVTGTIKLIEPSVLWNNTKVLNRRFSNNSVTLLTKDPDSIRFRTQPNFKSKAVIDYILRNQTFSPQKIPLLFIYNVQPASPGVEFVFKYKLNDRWREKLSDVDISVTLCEDLVLYDCKSVPSAHSLRNNKITWKTKEIHPNGTNAKGKIILGIGRSNVPVAKMLKDIRITMKTTAGLLEALRAECLQDDGLHTTAEKMLLIQYRIQPHTPNE